MSSVDTQLLQITLPANTFPFRETHIQMQEQPVVLASTLCSHAMKTHVQSWKLSSISALANVTGANGCTTWVVVVVGRHCEPLKNPFTFLALPLQETNFWD